MGCGLWACGYTRGQGETITNMLSTLLSSIVSSGQSDGLDDMEICSFLRYTWVLHNTTHHTQKLGSKQREPRTGPASPSQLRRNCAIRYGKRYLISLRAQPSTPRLLLSLNFHKYKMENHKEVKRKHQVESDCVSPFRVRIPDAGKTQLSASPGLYSSGE